MLEILDLILSFFLEVVLLRLIELIPSFGKRA